MYLFSAFSSSCLLLRGRGTCKRSRGEGDGRSVRARDWDSHSGVIVAAGITGRCPCFNGDSAGPVGTTSCTCFSPRRGPTRQGDRMRRRVGPERAGHSGLGAQVEVTLLFSLRENAIAKEPGLG